MQLYAFDRSGQLIFSCNAKKKLNYRCLECGALVRLREGFIRHPHFYHLKRHSPCRQHGKGVEHLHLQMHLKNLIPEVCLENRFCEISRIADVAWHDKKIIFEIQCSFISKEEMENRVKDYRSIGYEVVWILHDKRYNRWRLTAFEYGLQGHSHYYSDMNSEGKGSIYDQWQVVEKGVRKQSLPPLKIDPRKPYFMKKRLGFEGDIASLPEDHPYLVKIREKSREMAQIKRIKGFWGHLKRSYENLIKYFLKPYCD